MVISKMETVVNRGFRGVVSEMGDFYNLDAIISVGYRVNSAKATHFRIWATKVLKEFIQKGFVLDDERLKQGKTAFGKDYFRELLERVRSIRASERRIWQQITDIFAECSIDYDRNSAVTKEFYAMVQNKFHYAITGQTAAEIIYNKADHTKDNMGLTTWKYAPDGRILKSDVVVAKNYLEEKEIRQLERAVTGYFDYIEDLIERENTFNMKEFADSVNEFLSFRRYDILKDKGRISRIQAENKAEAEYVIALAHLGDLEQDGGHPNSVGPINNTNGIDAVIDGHEHSIIEERFVSNKDGKPVLLTSSGSYFQYVGMVSINTNGTVESMLVDLASGTVPTDANTQQFVDNVKEEVNLAGQRVVGRSEVFLTVYDEEGNYYFAEDYEQHLVNCDLAGIY